MLASSLGFALIALFAADWAFFRELEGKALDWRFRLRGPAEAPQEVAIIAIDDRSIATLGHYPLPRAALAQAIERLRALGARGVGLDILLLEREAPSEGNLLSPGDQRLRAAFVAEGKVVLAVALLFGPGGSLPAASNAAIASSAYALVARPSSGALALPRASGALVPVLPFAEAASLGHVNLMLEPGGEPRSLAPAIGVGEFVLPAFHVVLARHHLDLSRDALVLSLAGELGLGDRRVPLDVDMSQPLDFYGSTGTITTLSLLDLLEDRVAAEEIAGRSVLIGATALGVGDTFGTPFAGALPGVELLATGLANLVEGKTLLRNANTRALDALLALLLGLAAWGAAWLPRPRLAALAGLMLLTVWLIANQIAFARHGIWLNVTLPTLSFLLAAALVAVVRVGHERRLRGEAERQRRNLARYVSPVMADELAMEELPSFDQREQAAAILFLDLSGFTTESELRTAADTARFLKEFHGRIEQVVAAHSGVIEQFAGDGAMVIFGLPEPRSDDPVRALACARALLTDLAAWRPGQSARAGLHYGPVVMARLGGAAQAQLAAAGDTVNVASRLEQLARDQQVALVVSESLAEAVWRAGRADLLADFVELKRRQLRGRQGTMTVWLASARVLGIAVAKSKTV